MDPKQANQKYAVSVAVNRRFRAKIVTDRQMRLPP
jgi:hypothetical protein